MRLKNNTLFGYILGLVSACLLGVSAITLYMANDIGYKPNDTKWKVNDISEALDQLYSESYTYSCETSVAEPNLGTNNKLIPVTLSDDGIVTYADTKEEWYSYCNKEWANAVILIDTPSKEYQVNDIILEDDIESYFVWIPKYQYRLWNTGVASKTTHSIEIIFSTKDTGDEEGVSCATPMTSGNLGNCNNGEWMTHPAFISMDVDGFWVGKFETGYLGATSVSTAQVTSADETKIIVKPNVYSWRYNTVYNMFVSSYEYERDLNSHMMKNTEWGAVAILSHSIYGIDYEVAINNSSYKTGYASLPSVSQVSYPGISGDGEAYNALYNTEYGYLASTTGNITGVYDMSGGAYEYMASYRGNTLGSSGFNTTTIAEYDSKYFDVYNPSSEQTTYSYMVLGDATGEMGPISNYVVGTSTGLVVSSWYADHSYFVVSSSPWFARGGYYTYGVLAGQFVFSSHTGAVDAGLGSRLVLSPQ